MSESSTGKPSEQGTDGSLVGDNVDNGSASEDSHSGNKERVPAQLPPTKVHRPRTRSNPRAESLFLQALAIRMILKSLSRNRSWIDSYRVDHLTDQPTVLLTDPPTVLDPKSSGDRRYRLPSNPVQISFSGGSRLEKCSEWLNGVRLCLLSWCYL
ncbi:hypothetical protein BJV74DRAFT_79164 [Russula compacta]|nr:hypothetical protein BJV74DRAFT_79164 [Russula compacta]